MGSSFFPPFVLEHKIYRVGQKLTALVALSQFIVVGGVSAAAACLGLSQAILLDLRLLQENAEEQGAAGGGPQQGEWRERTRALLAVRACMLVPTLAFFLVVPLVQIPL